MVKVYRLAVCKGPNCTLNGGNALFDAVREAVAAQGLSSRCLTARGGCYGMCAFGPNLIVRALDPLLPPDPLSSADFRLLGTPDEYLYSGLQAEQAATLVSEHVGADRPVAAWLHANSPRR
ncbi:MAG: (2Fe-2S) ferredoxin domain-containing protein [Deltaproteobacteria bacterium]